MPKTTVNLEGSLGCYGTFAADYFYIDFHTLLFSPYDDSAEHAPTGISVLDGAHL